jgi:hypothetical protein
MKCDKIRELLRDYLRGQTDSQTTGAVTTHLGTCEDCARELAFLKAYYSKIGSLENLKAPDSLLINIKQQLAQTGNKAETSRWSKLWVWKAPQIAGALAVALIVLLVFNPFQNGQKLRQDAKLLQETAPQTAASKDQSQEMGVLGSTQSQSNSALAPEMEKQTLAANGVPAGVAPISGEGSQTAGGEPTRERRIIFTMRKPTVMESKAFDDVGASKMERSAALKTEMEQKPETEKSGLKKEQDPAAFNSTGVLAVKALIKSVAGEVIKEDFEGNGQPPSLLIRIPVQNYTVFLAKLQEIGSITSEGSAAPPPPSKAPGTGESNQRQFMETRLILKGVF